MIYANEESLPRRDSALLMEKVVEDLGEVIKDAKNRLGYSKVDVLAGWSGGGSLSLYYQQQAEPLGLIPADGIMLLAAHIQPPTHSPVARCVRCSMNRSVPA